MRKTIVWDSPEIKNIIVQMMREGKSIGDIGTRFNRNATYMYRVIAKHTPLNARNTWHAIVAEQRHPTTEKNEMERIRVRYKMEIERRREALRVKDLNIMDGCINQGHSYAWYLKHPNPPRRNEAPPVSRGKPMFEKTL